MFTRVLHTFNIGNITVKTERNFSIFYSFTIIIGIKCFYQHLGLYNEKVVFMCHLKIKKRAIKTNFFS